MIRYLLDTNVLSEPTKLSPNSRLIDRLSAMGGEVGMASVTWHELLYGLRRMPGGKRRDMIADYLYGVVEPTTPVFPFDTPAAEWLAQERARLDAEGRPRPVVDGMIAAVAATRGLTLVTRNAADFGGFSDLTIENWFEA
ncbi:MAG: type II toxin-antitoxin system VapC family toxin [Bacteroidota bacterium]